MRKIITLGIMLLFLGMTISSSTGLYLEKQSIKPLSSGNTLYVGGSGSGNYTKIQDAIDNSSNGDTVFVFDDSSPYFENIIIDKSINLIGEKRHTTIIDGNELGIVVKITSNYVNISKFTIRNCSFGSSAGVRGSTNYSTISNNNIISNNRSGLVLLYSHFNTITGNII
ncbi:parallel beta-helix repeat (two copies), partial [Thermoplasmatales archaeon SCGC AB-540-F20]